LIRQTALQDERISRLIIFDMKQQILNLGKDSLIYGVGSVVTRFIGLITLPLFTAYLTPEEFGVLAMLALLTMVAQPVFSLGLSAAMGPSYFGSDSPLNKSKAVWTVFTINIVSATALVAIAWLIPEKLSRLVRLSADYSPLLSLSLTGCALTILVTSFTQRVQFEKQAMLYVAAILVTALTAILLSAITVVFLGWGIKGMVIGQLAGNTATFFAFLFLGLKATKPAVSFVMAKEMLRLGLPLAPGFMFLFILMHANKYILEWQTGLDAVGIYSVGFNLGMAISIVTGGIATAWYPFFMSYMKRQSEVMVIFGRIFTYYFFSVGLLTIFFFLAAKPTVYLLTQERFHDAYLVVGYVALSNFLQTLFCLFLPGLYFKSEVKYVSLVQGLAALISLPINYFLIFNMGLIGAGIGLVAGNLLMVILMYGWNCLNSTRYPTIKYEWGRLFSFIVLAIVIIIFYEQLPVTSIGGEILKSMLLFLIASCFILFLLNKKEKLFLFQNR
jgi:O-antigen/teichoic acid export membrane protein